MNTMTIPAPIQTPKPKLLPTRPRDKYDDAIDYLTLHPDEIFSAWNKPNGVGGHRAGCLFQYVSPDGKSWCDGRGANCLTQIRSGYSGWTEDITNRIRNNLSIPTDPRDITPQHLIHFANEQRRLDVELNRV